MIATTLLAGCGAAASVSHDSVSPDASSATPPPSDMQQAWLRGVGVDAPAEWKRDATQCGTPMHDTVVVDYASGATPACLVTRPPTDISVIELSTGNANPMPADAKHGEIDGIPVLEASRRTDDGRHEQLVRFPDRAVTVDITSPDRAVVEAARQSLQVVDTDPTTGCAVHSTAYNNGTPPAQGNPDELLPGEPTSAAGCAYAGGWLDMNDVVAGDDLDALVDAVRAAPETTEQRAPDDANCESVADMQSPEDNAPMVLHFDYADGSAWTLVAKINWCTRWQSTISSGDVTRRIDRRLLLALPPLWGMTPDPDSMDIG